MANFEQLTYRRTDIEKKLEGFIELHKCEWLVVCGEKTATYNEMLKILKLLRDEELHELEAMMIWKMEYLEVDKQSV